MKLFILWLKIYLIKDRVVISVAWRSICFWPIRLAFWRLPVCHLVNVAFTGEQTAIKLRITDRRFDLLGMDHSTNQMAVHTSCIALPVSYVINDIDGFLCEWIKQSIRMKIVRLSIQRSFCSTNTTYMHLIWFSIYFSPPEYPQINTTLCQQWTI